MLGKIEDRRKRECQKMSGYIALLTMDMNLNKLWEIVKDRKGWSAAVMGPQRFGCNLVTEQHVSSGISRFVISERHLSIVFKHN